MKKLHGLRYRCSLITPSRSLVADRVRPRGIFLLGALFGMKRLELLPPPPPVDGMIDHRWLTPRSKFAGTHLYTGIKRGTIRIKCPAQKHNALHRPTSKSLLQL